MYASNLRARHRILEHQLIGIENVFLKLGQRGSLAEDAWNLLQPAHEPAVIHPVFEVKVRCMIEPRRDALAKEQSGAGTRQGQRWTADGVAETLRAAARNSRHRGAGRDLSGPMKRELEPRGIVPACRNLGGSRPSPG